MGRANPAQNVEAWRRVLAEIPRNPNMRKRISLLRLQETHPDGRIEPDDERCMGAFPQLANYVVVDKGKTEADDVWDYRTSVEVPLDALDTLADVLNKLTESTLQELCDGGLFTYGA